MVSSEAPPDAPYDAEAFYRERVAAVANYAASGIGAGHATLYFMSGIEREYGIDTNPLIVAGARHLQNSGDADVARQLQNIGAIIGTTPIQNLSEDQRAVKLAETKEDACTFVDSLEPASDKEAARQMQWRRNIETFTAQDAINFLLYKELSVGTLGDTSVPLGCTYEQLQEYSRSQGWLEFRFGNGLYQTGYYDNKETAEFRLTPCPPNEVEERYRIVNSRLIDIAAEFGAVIFDMGNHIGLSAYHAGRDGIMRPVLGSNPCYVEAALNASAGIAAAIQDGAWLAERQVTYPANFLQTAPERFVLSAHRRTGLHLHPDYVELRAKDAKESIAQGLLWMMAGITYGLEKGSQAIAEAGYNVPVVLDGFEVVTTEEYDKIKHLHVLRALQESVVGTDHRLLLNINYNRQRPLQIAGELQGLIGLLEDRQPFNGDHATALLFNEVVLNSMQLGKTGTISCTADTLLSSFKQLKNSMQARLPFMANQQYRQEAARGFNIVMSVFRMVSKQAIGGENLFIGELPIDRQKRMIGSEVVRLAFGEQTETHVKRLMAAGQAAVARHSQGR